MIQLLEKIDMDLLKFIHDYSQNALFDWLMPVISFLGDKGLIWIVISIALIVSKKYRQIGFMTLGALAICTILGEGLLKHIIQRQRPFSEVPAIHLLVTKPLTYSFPSGHTASAFAAAGIIAKMIRKYTVPVMILAVLIAFSRLYLFVHYPSDVLAGIVLGLASAGIVLYLPIDTLILKKVKCTLEKRSGI